MDERKESAEYYPGGRTAQGGGGSGGGSGDESPKVPVTPVSGLPENYRESDMRDKINQLCRIVSGGVAALAVMVTAQGAQVTAQRARKDALWNSDMVVTNVTAELGDVATTNWVEGRLSQSERDIMDGVYEATNGLAEAINLGIAAATNGAVELLRGETAAQMEEFGAETDAKLTNYATQAWVEGQGYLKGTNMTAYAERQWVLDQGFLTAGALTGYATLSWIGGQDYATKAWVQGRGYLTQHQSLADYATKGWVEGKRYIVATNLNGYAKESWVNGKGYATTNWVQGRGYLTQHQSLSGYATTNWVQGRGYLTQHQSLADYATKGWVEGKRYLVATNLNGYAKESWVNGKGYATTNWVQGRLRETESAMQDGLRRSVGEAVREAAMQMDGATANRLMMPGDDRWIDGTGAVWQVWSVAGWDGEWVMGAAGATNWTRTADAEDPMDMPWTLEYAAYTSATGTWRLVRTMSKAGPLEVTYEAAGLPYGDGAIALTAVSAATNGVEVTPGSVTDGGWYQIPDGAGNLHFVSPLVTTATVARVTNAVDRLARIEDLTPGMTTNDVCAIVTNVTDEWVYEGLPDGAVITLPPRYIQDQGYPWEMMFHVGSQEYAGFNLTYDSDLNPVRFDCFDMGVDSTNFAVTATRVTRNALGLARLVDLPTKPGDIGAQPLLTFDTTPTANSTNPVTSGGVKAALNSKQITIQVGGGDYTSVDDTVMLPSDVDGRSTNPDAIVLKSALEAEMTPIVNSVNAMWATMYGENVWLAVTNYMRQIAGTVPSLRLWEVRDSSTNLVYSSDEEITHVVTQRLHVVETNLNAKMPRTAWGSYQSSGEDNPSSNAVTVVNSQKIMLTGGGEWYRMIETGSAAVWVLKSSGLTSMGGDTNGYFRVCDLEGNAQIEVVKTADQIVEAVAYDVGFDGGGNFTVTFNASGSEHPRVSCAASLADDFVEEDDSGEINSLGITVTWAKNGDSMWVATIHQDSHSRTLFVYGKVKVAGENLVRNNAPTSLAGGVFINGVKYRLVPYTSGGKTYLTLEAW